MPRRAKIEYRALKSSLVNLPLSIYGGLVQGNVLPQGLGVHLKPLTKRKGKENSAGKYEKDGVYLGWTGMASAASLAHYGSASKGGGEINETVEMDPQLGRVLGSGFAEGDIVEIGLIHDLPSATNVATEPISDDDWEILELHAEYVESNLLSQVRCARISQEIVVWVLGRTVVRMRVVSTTPTHSSNAAILTTNTEVTIAPRLRKPKDVKPQTITDPASAESVKERRKKTPRHVLRILPSKYFTFTTSLPVENGVYHVLNSPPPPTQLLKKGPVGFVSLPTFWDIHHMLDPKRSRNQEVEEGDQVEDFDEEIPQSISVLVERAIPPFEVAQLADSSKPKEKEGDGERVLHRAGAEAIEKDTNTKAAGEGNEPEWMSKLGATMKLTLYPPLGEEEVIPDRECVVFWPDDRDVLEKEVKGTFKDWDLVFVTYLQSPNTEEVEGESYNLLKRNPPPPPIYNPIAVSNIIQPPTDYLRRHLYLQMGLVKGAGRIDAFGSVLLHGVRGSGKSLLARALGESLERCERWRVHNTYVDLSQSKYTSLTPVKLKEALTAIIDEAAWHKPAVVILDGLDKVCKVEVEHAPSHRTTQTAHLISTLLSPYTTNPLIRPTSTEGLLVITTSESMESLHPRLMETKCFGKVVKIGGCDREGRKAILEHYVRARTKNGYVTVAEDEDEDGVNYAALASTTEGYSPVDLQDLVGRAVHLCAVRRTAELMEREDQDEDEDDGVLTLSMRDFDAAQKDFTPLSLRDVPLTKSAISWADIGGLKDVKKMLRETLEFPTKYAVIFKQSPLRLRSGLLLYGYPGCGKTLLASAVAKECGLNFISVKGPELLNKYIGQSEKSVRDLFERASGAKPCVLFFDEFDSIAPRRGHDSTGVTDRVVNQMLTQMDGAEGLEGVYVLAATSRPDLIDPALLRPGRLDKSILCDMPSAEDRKEILEALSSKVAVEDTSILADLAQQTEGFSGADLQALMYNAHLESVHEHIDAMKKSGIAKGSGVVEKEVEYVEVKPPGVERERRHETLAEKEAFKRKVAMIVDAPRRNAAERERRVVASSASAPEIHKVTQAHLMKSLRSTRPSVSLEERARLGRIYDHFLSGRDGKLPVPPSGDSKHVGMRVSLA